MPDTKRAIWKRLATRCHGYRREESGCGSEASSVARYIRVAEAAVLGRYDVERAKYTADLEGADQACLAIERLRVHPRGSADVEIIELLPDDRWSGLGLAVVNVAPANQIEQSASEAEGRRGEHHDRERDQGEASDHEPTFTTRGAISRVMHVCASQHVLPVRLPWSVFHQRVEAGSSRYLLQVLG